MWTVVLAAGVLTGGVLGVAPRVVGQSNGVNQAGPDYLHGQAGMDPFPQHKTPEDKLKAEQMKQAERHKRVAADAAKLVELANDLKAKVDQAPNDQLSLDVMRKAADIEKLAHDVKERMKN